MPTISAPAPLPEPVTRKGEKMQKPEPEIKLRSQRVEFPPPGTDYQPIVVYDAQTYREMIEQDDDTLDS